MLANPRRMVEIYPDVSAASFGVLVQSIIDKGVPFVDVLDELVTLVEVGGEEGLPLVTDIPSANTYMYGWLSDLVKGGTE